jgi:hypothetical protein
MRNDKELAFSLRKKGTVIMKSVKKLAYPLANSIKINSYTVNTRLNYYLMASARLERREAAA